MKKRILITGANGFVGKHLCEYLLREGLSISQAVRKKTDYNDKNNQFTVDLDNENADWSLALSGCHAVVHLGSRVHVINDLSNDPLNSFQKTNTEGTLILARQAAKANVRRFVFISSIGVNGAETYGTPFKPDDEVKPHSPYAISKYEAERGLEKICDDCEMELVIIRPPAIYGLNAPGNFRLINKLLTKKIPLPLASVSNKRSLINVHNLVDLIYKCLLHPDAAGQLILASDGDDLSTPQIIELIAALQGARTTLLNCPQLILKLIFLVTGKKKISQSLLGDLQIDITKTKAILNWQPPHRPSKLVKN